MLDPVARIAGFVGSDFGKGRVEEGVADGGGVDQDQVFEVGIDAVLHGQVHEHGAGDGAVHRPVGHMDEGTVLVAQQEQNDFFGESQH